jgi:hypothetical protein
LCASLYPTQQENLMSSRFPITNAIPLRNPVPHSTSTSSQHEERVEALEEINPTTEPTVSKSRQRSARTKSKD